MTCDRGHVTPDTRYVGRGGVNIFPKFHFPSCYCLWFMILRIYGGKGSLPHWMNEWRGCLKNSPGYTGPVKYMLGWRRKSYWIGIHSVRRIFKTLIETLPQKGDQFNALTLYIVWILLFSLEFQIYFCLSEVIHVFKTRRGRPRS